MVDEDRKREEDEEIEEDTGHPFNRRRRGSHDPFFSDFDREFEEMRRYMDQLMQATMRGEMGQGSTGKPFIYGFTMKTGPDGRPVFQEFGNTKNVRRMNGQLRPGIDRGQCDASTSRSPPPAVRGREPLTDVIDCGDTIAVTIELPGVDKNDIELDVQEDTLSIKVNTESRRYFKEVELPAEVKGDTAKASYNNGVLDITLKKKAPTPTKKKGKRVKIE